LSVRFFNLRTADNAAQPDKKAYLFTGVINFRGAALLAALLFLVLTAWPARPAFALTDDEKAARAFKFAKGLFDMQKYGQAASELQKFISFYEKSRYGEYALYLLGESLYKTEDFKGAGDKYESFLKKYPDSKLTGEVYYSAAYTAAALGDDESAYGYFRKLYKNANPDLSRDAVFKCARHLLAKKDADGAKSAFADYFKLTEGGPAGLSEDETARFKEALYISGNLALREKNEKEAAAFYEKFLKSFDKDPMAAPVYYNIGEISYSAGQYKKAAENYSKALANIEAAKKNSGGVKPDEDPAADYSSYIPKIYYSLGWCHYSQSDYREASEYFSKCFNEKRKFDNRADCGLRLGISLFNLKKYELAAQVFKEVKNIKGLSPKISHETDYYLGMALQKSGLLSEAYERFTAISNSSDEISVEALYVSAVILFDQKKYELAVDKFRGFLSRFPGSKKSQHAAFNIGLAYFNLARYQEAREALLEFIKNFPASNYLSRSYFNLGEISMIEKKYDEAINWFSKIPASDPMWLESELKVCDAYFALKDMKKLAEKYRQILAAVDTVSADADYLVPALFKMGKNLSALGENGLAAKAFEKITAVSKSPRNTLDAKFKLAQIHFEIKEFDKCLALCAELAAAKEPGGGSYSVYEAKELGGRAKAALLKYDEAMAAFDEILASQDAPEHVRYIARFDKASLYSDKKDYQKAVESFEQLALDVQDVELLAKIHYILGGAYDALNNAEEAVKNLLKIEILYKDTAVVHDARLRLLEIYVKTKQKKDAKNLKAEIMKSSAPKAVKDRANELTKK
jgi:TolA-binding protein